jgi:hypothetical protein
VGAQRLAGLAAHAVHQVQHARRDAGLQRKLAQPLQLPFREIAS